MSRRFSLFILLGMVLGVVVGWACNTQLPAAEAGAIADNLKIVTDIFLRLIKMIIAPLVFATLVAGIANMGSGAKLGRVFAKSLGWFIGASFISLLLGLVMVNLLRPGADFPGALPDKIQNPGL